MHAMRHMLQKRVLHVKWLCATSRAHSFASAFPEVSGGVRFFGRVMFFAMSDPLQRNPKPM